MLPQKGALGVVVGDTVGILAGNGAFPILFAKSARSRGYKVVAICHEGETDPALCSLVDEHVWIRLGELGKIISTFQNAGVQSVVMAGGISRVKWFGGVKLDLLGAALLARLRSTKDDVIMRGIADELGAVGIEVIPCTVFAEECFVPEGILTKSAPSKEEREDIKVGIEAIRAMSTQDIGQVVVVREGVIVAVEAAEGTDRAILRGGELGGSGNVVVKFAKPTQDMRFDVPTVGPKTLESLIAARSRVLALEAGRTLILEQEKTVELANKHHIAIIGCPSLVIDGGIG